MDDIWTFVEDKLKAPVPAYFKSVLNVCGYSNGISISLIEEDDLIYIENEVKSGNVGKALDGATDFLKGCTRNAENFEFVLGHKKFLLAIAKYLKKYIDEHGADYLILNKNYSKNHAKNKKNQSKAPPSKRSVIPSLNLDKLVPLVENTMERVNLNSNALKIDLKSDIRLTTKTNPIFDNHQEFKSRKSSGNFDELQYKSLGGHSPIDDHYIKNGKYVIYCMCLKSWVCWPNVKPPVKYFVGRVSLFEDHGKKLNSEIELIVLKKSPYKRHNFSCPENYETQKVSKKNILQILQDPVKNRRGELVFQDKSVLDYTFD